MATAFDPRKSAKNIEERGLSFELAHGMEWETALLIVDEIGYLPVIPGGGNLFF